MSLTLTERYTLANDETFISKVKVQAISTAINFSGSNPDETVKEYCQLIIKDPENTTRSMQLAHGTAAQMDVPDIASVADSYIKIYLEIIFSAYAYAEFNKTIVG
ncbi:MAG: hypothetical protein ABI091_03555 [Ferruginibacter sp.]